MKSIQPLQLLNPIKVNPVNLNTPIILDDLMVYLKTTETCQLDCKHCFTNGINGQKINFDVDKTIDFFHRLHDVVPTINSGNISFFGGEPFLVPVKDMDRVYEECKDLWDNLWWSCTTNLVFNIDDEKLAFMKKVFKNGIGTSWDKGIRFANDKQEELWKKNVKLLTKELEGGLTIMISLSKDIIEMEPVDLINWASDLGFSHIHLERITPDGNAIGNENLFPSNKELDEWFVKMFDQTVEYKLYEKITNSFLNSILSSLVNMKHSGCRCRECEKKILTLNATGTIGGCPNWAMTNTFGTIDDDIRTLLTSPGRIANIACEADRNPICYSCDVFDLCNGDCNQLAWEEDICASPKSLMRKLKEDNNIELYEEMLQGFIGQE